MRSELINRRETSALRAFLNADARVLFFAFNNDTQLKTFVPVIRHLKQEYSVDSLVVSGCELKGIATDFDRLASLGVAHELLEPKVRSRRWSQLLSSATVGRQRIMSLLDEYSPSAVVVGHDHAVPNNYIVQQARRRGIPSVLLQDGVMRNEPGTIPRTERLIKSLAGIPLRYGQGGCTRVAVWGSKAREYFLAVGVSPENVRIVGCPRFDRVLTGEELSDPRASSVLPPVNRRIVYLAGGEVKFGIMTAGEHNTILLAMLRAQRELNAVCTNTDLVIKLHRDDDLAGTRDFLRSNGGEDSCTVMQSEVDLYALLSTCDVAVTFSSTAGLEALLLNKPLILFNPTTRPDLVDYVQGGGALGARTADELKSRLCDILTNREFLSVVSREKNDYLTSQLGVLDGCATSRVANLVVSLMPSELQSRLSTPASHHSVEFDALLTKET